MPSLLTAVRRVDARLVLAMLVLISLGFSAIYSITLSQNGQSFLLVQKQLIALFVGLVLVFLIIWSNYRWTRSFALPIYILANLLLIAVLFFGESIRGTMGWFPVFGFHFQPVEFAKLGVIVALARYFSDYRSEDFGWKNIFISGLIVGLPTALTLLQPDLGSALLLLSVWVGLLFFAGLKVKHFLVLGFLGSLSVIFAWFFLFVDYQKSRIMSFVNPGSDPMGEGYNVRQAIIAIGSGGWFGRGLGFGSQSQLKFVPESQTDFIFAVIAEEFGLLGSVLLCGAFYLLLRRIFRHAFLTRDDFTSFLLTGIGSLFLFSFLVNVGMSLGLMPVTGIALPLVSYGGSALIIALILLGIAQSVAVHDVAARSAILIENEK
ncbi:MAG: Rod shape-determining protein RodA [Candidatus Uhrbacteria bacterium GW2011_GWE2_45_35]|uniref:Rod shape-determining protein RodA n=2 Tax=Candidatus Uhriibacteriota TaxID=1752732 RepID=A0A0G1MD92_9BACT|nr:MAG: Rod shape-determining protein RodA [Candidatus Uhrbacteria bacterium GW2011_GWF2_44_350]KKU08915.1 MAG: Rod shape-determining protein RodA [Candidatus Uhrbacteria bacterium GW2011_GWE2_45_35]HBR80953.1 rod shape-determining protein RodA [Candidatus Uhrbacteria bacterium]HCU31901.1 rod shape-determining protein RodA [Candidatus Uhrbacteria bacterium]